MESQKYNIAYNSVLLALINRSAPGHAWACSHSWGPVVSISGCAGLSCFLWLRRKMGRAISMGLKRTIRQLQKWPWHLPIAKSNCRLLWWAQSRYMANNKVRYFPKIIPQKRVSSSSRSLKSFLISKWFTLHYFILKSNILFKKKKKWIALNDLN